MQGMDRKHDGHLWCVMKTTDIKNDYALTFRQATCVGHLSCMVEDCPCQMQTKKINEVHWEGVINNPFQLGHIPSTHSTIICRYCKNPPSYMPICNARMYYVVHKLPTRSKACILFWVTQWSCFNEWLLWIHCDFKSIGEGWGGDS